MGSGSVPAGRMERSALTVERRKPHFPGLLGRRRAARHLLMEEEAVCMTREAATRVGWEHLRKFCCLCENTLLFSDYGFRGSVCIIRGAVGEPGCGGQ